MEKTPKKILGILGLLAVAAMTAFAVTIETPSTSALETVTDNISVRVLARTPLAKIEAPANKSQTTHSYQSVKYSYEFLSSLSLTLEYFDEHGVLQEIPIASKTIPTEEEEYGEGSFDLNLSDYGLSYGSYVLKLSGVGLDGVNYEDSVTFEYFPVTIVVRQDETTGDVIADLDYDSDDSNIDTIKIDVIDKTTGESIFPAITVNNGTTSIILPFISNNIPEGTYQIIVTAFNAEGDSLYKPFVADLIYSRAITPSDTPNTGQPTRNNLKISQTDYLVTGCLVLFTAGAAGVYTITRHNKNSKKTSRRK